MQVISVAMYMVVTYFFGRIQISNAICQVGISFLDLAIYPSLSAGKNLCFTITTRKIKNEAYLEIPRNN